MGKKKLGFIGDLHYDGLVRIFGNIANTIITNEVISVAKKMKKKGIRHILLLGDIADKPVLSPHAELEFLRLLSSLHEMGMVVHVLLGNHDYEHKEGNSLIFFISLKKAGFLPKDIHFYTEPTAKKVAGYDVDFLPWPHDTPMTKNSLRIAHLERKGTFRDNGHEVTDGKPIGDNEGTWVVGHLHTSQSIKDWHWTGTLIQQNFGETTRKFWGYYDGDMHFVRHKSCIKLRVLTCCSKKEVKQAFKRVEKSDTYHRFKLKLLAKLPPVQLGKKIVYIEYLSDSAKQEKDNPKKSGPEQSVTEQLRTWCTQKGISKQDINDALTYLGE